VRSDVQAYEIAITDDIQFNQLVVRWTFWLIGKDYDGYFDRKLQTPGNSHGVRVDSAEIQGVRPLVGRSSRRRARGDVRRGCWPRPRLRTPRADGRRRVARQHPGGFQPCAMVAG
jgi:hypothetical protein